MPTEPTLSPPALPAATARRDGQRVCWQLVLTVLTVMAAALNAQSQFRELSRGVLPFRASPADCLAMADIDQDGDRDLALGQSSGWVQLWLQMTPNTYRNETARLPLPQPHGVRALVFADLDRDGDADLVVISAAGERILINQAGRFRDESATRLPGLADDSRDGIVFDADRDGDDDLFVANVGQDRLYLNDGAGVFSDGTASRLPADIDSTGTASPIDADGDGDLDIFLGNNGFDRLLSNDGRGTFAVVPNWSPVPFHTSHDSTVLDIDRDGDPDIVVANSFGAGVYRNDRVGWVGVSLTNGLGGSIRTVAAGDIDRDGWPDLLLGRLGPTEFLVNLRSRELRFAPTTGAFPAAVSDVRAAAVTDLDGDGDNDVTVATASGSAMFFNDGAGGFLDPPSTALIASPLPAVAAVGDAEADGDSDLVLVSGSWADGTLHAVLHESDGRGRFVRFPIHLQPIRANAAVFTDLTGDGLADIACAADGPEALLIAQGRGSFVDRSANLGQRNDRTLAVAAGDVDGDGDPDLVFAGEDHLFLERNTGLAMFQTSAIAPLQAYVTGIALADLDRDGDLDLAIAAFGSSSRVFHNDGRGSFTPWPGFVPPPADSRAIAAADIDQDGDADLLFANWGQNRVYRNDPAGFVDVTALVLPPNEDACAALALGDVDGDGDLDLLFGVLGPDRLLLNDGRGTFIPANGRLETVDETTRSLHLFESDGDGDLDLLSVALLGRPRLLTNLTRQLQPRSYALLGCPYDADFFAEPWRGTSQAILPLLALAVPSGPFITPFGILWLDPANTVVLPARMTSAATGTAPLQLAIPNEVTFRGVPIAAQALVLHGTGAASWRLTNLLADRVPR